MNENERYDIETETTSHSIHVSFHSNQIYGMCNCCVLYDMVGMLLHSNRIESHIIGNVVARIENLV